MVETFNEGVVSSYGELRRVDTHKFLWPLVLCIEFLSGLCDPVYVLSTKLLAHCDCSKVSSISWIKISNLNGIWYLALWGIFTSDMVRRLSLGDQNGVSVSCLLDNPHLIFKSLVANDSCVRKGELVKRFSVPLLTHRVFIYLFRFIVVDRIVVIYLVISSRYILVG